uniref:Cadherin domain-containing protein n=1 Tax=Globodera rostochiensis TaxID=31243 RepID=A0A914I5N4_GLORO
MPNILLCFTLFFALGVKICAKKSSVCVFPEARERALFFDIPTNVPARSILVDTVVEPSDAKLSIANIRANNLEPDVDLDAQLALEKRPNGQFLVITAGFPPVVRFPDYPSTVNETLLYVTVRCNGRLYPLITVRVRNANMHTPEFLGTQPYELSIARNAPAGTLFETPLKALDLDAAEQYSITFGIEPPFDRDFALVLADQPSQSAADEARLLSVLPPAYSRRVEHWHQRQMPPNIQLKVLAKSLASTGKSVYYLNVSANDNGQPEAQVAYAQLKVSVKEAREAAARFSRTEYFANFTKEMVPGGDLPPNGEQPIQATFPAQRAGDRVRYELDQANPYAQLFEMDPWTGRLRLAQRVPDGVPAALELDLTAHLIPRDSASSDGATPSGQSVRAKITLIDQTEVRLTYFAQCHYETHLAENPSAYTRVLQFNFRGDVQGVELLNGSELFKVDSDGMMSVRPGVNIDRENTDRIVVKARLRSRGTLHPRSLELCQIATADIHIDDVNDHSPRFKRRSYRFRIDAHPFNNTEVGSLRAIDGDKGEFGRVRYRLLEEFVPDGRDGEEPLPFVMFQGDGAATLFFVIKPLHMELGRQPYQPQQDYTFTVEAFDSTEDPRTARVTVNVRLADLTEQEAQHEREEAVRERQWEQQQEQQFELQQDEPSTHMELEEDGTDTTAVDATMLASHRHGLGSNGGGGRAHAVPTLVLDGTGAKAPLQMDNKFGELSSSDDAGRLRHSGAVAGLIRFSADKYIFRLRGPLTESQTIGQVQARRMGAGGASVDARFSQIEFAVEEGIAGFVGVDAGTGRLFVGPWLLRDRFEEIRFSVAAQQPSDGQVLATALVSVLIDDMGPPEFSTAQYQFELDQSGMDGTGWPRIVGQVTAIPFAGGDANGTTANGSNGNGPSTMFFYAFDDEQANNNEAIKWFDIDQFTGLISARGPIAVRDNQRKSVKFGLKACLRANATTCGRSSVEVIVFNNSNSAVVENGISAVARVEFIPLPRTVFLTTGKVPGSSILRVSVRALDPRDGSWHLLPPAATHQSMADDQNQHRLQVIYTVEVEGESQPATTAELFRMRDNILTLAGRAEPGEFNLTIRAHLSLEGSSSAPEEGTLHARDFLHPLRVIVMHEDGRQRYPVFERISYDFEVEPSARFPLVMQPSLNATLADHRPIRFSLFPARAGDPTDGLHIDAESGQLLIHRQFLDAIKAINQSSGAHEQGVQQRLPSSSTARSRNTAAEVFIVVRATNRAHPEFYSDASVALLVRSDRREGAVQSPLEFDASLYRVIVREDALVGTVLNGGAPITIVEPERHQNVRLSLQSPPDQEATSSLINSFQLLDNGSLVLRRQLDIELMDDASKGVVELEAVADEPNGGGSSGDDKPSRARVQVQVVDVDEFAPRFVPSSPEFRLHMPLIAGQPIGHLKAHDDDFADRQPDSLAFRTISGNASELVHVQRDGQLLVKDPKSWQTSSSSGQLLLFLLVEVRGTSGQTSQTTVKFVLEDAEANAAMEQTTVSISSSSMSETEQQPQEDEAGKDTATTVDTRGTTLEFTTVPVKHALFSVRDSLSPDELAQLRAGQLHFRLEESAQRTGSLFKLEANTGELFMEEKAAFNGMVSDDTEHEVSVQVLDQDQRLVARRLFTVRLVQRTTISTPTSTTSSRTATPTTTTTTTTTTTIGTSVKTAEEEASSSLKPTTTAIRWRLSQLHGAGEGNEGAETSTTLDESDEPFSTKTDIIPPAFSLAPPSNSRRAPTAAPLSFSSISAPGTTTTSSSTGTLKFALPRYHWIVSEPIRTALIGKLEVQGDGQMLESIIIEPPQFRTWFQLDQKSGELYLREVPDQLYGRQRAEFRAHLTALDGKWADAVVIVDLNLPPPQSSPTSSSSNGGNVDGTIVSNTDHRRTTIGQISTPGIEIAESSDQASRTAVASDTDTKTGSHRTASTPASIQLSSSTSTTTLPSASTLSARTSSSTSSTSTTSFSTRSSTTLSTTSSSHTDASSSPLSDQSSEESTDQPPFDEPTDHSPDQSSSLSTPSTSSWHTTLSSTSAHSLKPPEQENKIPIDKLHFASDEYRAMLPEGRYGNSGAQLSLRPQSLAQGMPRGVEFSIVADQPVGGTQQQLPFFVRRDTGELIAFAETDREEQAQYQFSVRAFDPVRNRSAETRVSVNILDVNDNFPQFVEPLPRVIAVGRLTTPGTVLAQFHAVDLDEGAHGTVRFHMALDNNRNGGEQQQQGGQQPFDMEPDGRLMFRGLPQQDGGAQDIFELRISAVDGGRPALRTEHKLRVELFAEGLPPTFKQSDFTAERVPAGAAQNGTFVAQVVAGTSDQIEYSLIDPPMANLFVIDARTGQIRMGRRPLDAERVREWTLHVRAKEGHGERATSARTTVHVFLDTFRPESPEGAEVESERLPSSSSSTTTASNDGTVVMPSGECRFSDRVFHSEIAENTEGRQRLTTLGTSDACAGRTLRFTLQQSNDAFVLDERTGDLYAVQPLDRERKSLYFLVTNLMIVNSNQQQHRPPPATAPSAAAVGMATVREVELEVHPAAQASTTDDGTTEEEDDTGEEANANRRKIRRQAVQQQQQPQQQQQRTKTKATRELFNGLVEQAKSKLEPNQALVLVHVLDRDDNTPQFEHLSEDGQIVFAVDWQLPVLGQIGRVFAHDADEHATLHYKLEQNANMAPMFAINETTGVVTLMRSFQAGIASADGGADEFRMNVFVSDGQHIAKAPLLIYKLQPGTNIVLLVINQPADQVDVLRAVRHMNMLLHGMEADVLVKQVYIGEDGQADTRRTHLLVYAVDKRTRVPVPAAKLKELLDIAFGHSASATVDEHNQQASASSTRAPLATAAADSPLRFLASVYVPEYAAAMESSPFRLTTAEITLLAISVLLVFCVCAMLFVLLRCCKNKQQTITKSDVEYMLDAQQAGPRPYNVELITRKMAQSAAGRRLPKPLEQSTLSPESRATMVASSGIYGVGGIGTTTTGQRRTGAGTRGAIAGTVAGADTTSSSERSGDSLPQQQQQQNGDRSDLQNLLMVRRRNSRSGNRTADQRRIQPITYESYDDAGVDDGAGACSIDGGPMLDTMSSSVEHSPEMARSSAGAGLSSLLDASTAVGTVGGTNRRGAPPREPPLPPPAANGPPATNIAGQRQQQAATIIGSTMA